MDLINLVRRTFDFTSKDAVTLSNKSIEAALVATTVKYDWTTGMGSPSITSGAGGAKEVTDIL